MRSKEYTTEQVFIKVENSSELNMEKLKSSQRKKGNIIVRSSDKLLNFFYTDESGRYGWGTDTKNNKQNGFARGSR